MKIIKVDINTTNENFNNFLCFAIKKYIQQELRPISDSRTVTFDLDCTDTITNIRIGGYYVKRQLAEK